MHNFKHHTNSYHQNQYSSHTNNSQQSYKHYQPQHQYPHNQYKRDNYIGISVEDTIKHQLVEYIYMKLDVHNIRFNMLKTIEHADQLKQQLYHVTPHFQGYNYLLIIKKLANDTTQPYIVYRMDLKSTKNDIDIKMIKIYKLHANSSLDAYDDTIFDGKLIFKKNEKKFIVSDVLYYNGINYLSRKIFDKLVFLNNVIQKFNDVLNSNFSISLAKLYKYSEMSDLVYNKIKNSDFKISGLVFIPERSGRIYAYVNDKEFELIKNSPNVYDTKNIVTVKLADDINIQNRKLLLQKTQIIDVYEVYNIDKTIRLGICAIPNIELSHKLHSYFKSNNQLITDCVYDSKFSKWKPLLV